MWVIPDKRERSIRRVMQQRDIDKVFNEENTME